MNCPFFDPDSTAQQNKYVMIQYMFDGQVVRMIVKPHGSTKSSTPYFRIAESAKTEHRNIAANNTPKAAVQIATLLQGGEIEAHGFNKLLRNAREMKNYRQVSEKRS